MEILSALSTSGYAELSDVHDIEQALLVTAELGCVVPLNGQAVQKLVPKVEAEATSQSFSKRHGRGLFPLHTDTAFWARPARFVVLFASSKSPTATRVLPLQHTQDLMAAARGRNPIFQRQTINGTIYSHPWIDDIGCCTLYDPCYMQPANHAGVDFVAATLESAAYVRRITWTGTNALVIDNWRVLHGRDDCDDDCRVLYRFYRGIGL